MKAFDNETMNWLSQFEHQFSCLLDSGFFRGAAQSDLKRMAELADQPNINLNCGQCLAEMMRAVATQYRKQKAEAKKPKAKKPAKAVDVYNIPPQYKGEKKGGRK